MQKSNALKRLKKRFAANGPAMTLGVVAIVLALTGGAIAASGALTAKQKKEVKSIAKTEAKKAQGSGPQGPKGDPGPAGAAGAKGENGANGTNGTNGAAGKSVKVTPIATGEPFECEGNGGALLKEEGAPSGTEVCSGKEGQDGKEGSPWSAGGTLPPGSTETGSWSFNGTEADTAGVRVPISFGIPFPFNVKAVHIHFGEANEGGAFVSETGVCPAASAFNPKAAPGELCIYKNSVEGLENATYGGTYKYATAGEEGTGRAGALLKFTPTGVAYGAGSFAVTGCSKVVGEPSECPAES